LVYTYLWHDSFAVLALDILERHLDALGRRNLDVGAVDVGDFGERDWWNMLAISLQCEKSGWKKWTTHSSPAPQSA
jgi:hypothetical protein